MNIVMESFKIYLPSNASQNIYPLNTSSDYKTHLDRPIVLSGEYEVGVESIFYSSNMKHSQDEKAYIYCTARTLDKNVHDFKVEIYPWHFDTIQKVMQNINLQVLKHLRQNLKWKYGEDIHHFDILHSSNGYSKLETGENLTIRLSDNLHSLFGLSKPTSKHPQSYGTRHVKDAIEVSQREPLLLLSNISKPTAYGQQRLQILQTFVYEASQDKVIEKRFQPITYLPLMTNNIDMIHLQITNLNYEPVNLQDCTTIICLYFRKVKTP